jgi:hypothetical protein
MASAAGPYTLVAIYVYTSLCVNTIEQYEERTRMLYTIDTKDYTVINRMWDLCQYSGRDIPMYRTRIGQGIMSWVVELDNDKYTSRFLLEFSSYVTAIADLD